MKTIRMRTTMAGPGGVLKEGQVARVDDALAQQLLDGRYAEEIKAAVAPQGETATAPRQRNGAGAAGAAGAAKPSGRTGKAAATPTPTPAPADEDEDDEDDEDAGDEA